MIALKKPSLYLVTDRKKKSIDEFLYLILQSIHGGVNLVQLREKETSKEEMVVIAKKLQFLLRPFGIPLIINDRLDVAKEVVADGVHLGQSDALVSEARAILGPNAMIGLSIETLEQLKKAQNEKIDYIAASPVFATPTKLDTNQPWGLEGLKNLCSISKLPVFAIGGINEGNIENVMECGVTGVAVVSAIFDAKDPKVAAQAIKTRMRGYANQRMG